MTCRTVAIAFVTAALLSVLVIYSVSRLLGPAFFWETEVPSSSITLNHPILPANPHVLMAARQGLEKYRDAHPYKDDWIIRVDDTTGTVETNWYREHKGEVQVKTQIKVWGNEYRVDTWQKVGWLAPTVHKTERATRDEMYIQEAVAVELQSTQ